MQEEDGDEDPDMEPVQEDEDPDVEWEAEEQARGHEDTRTRGHEARGHQAGTSQKGSTVSLASNTLSQIRRDTSSAEV